MLMEALQTAQSCKEVLQLMQQAGSKCDQFHYSKAVNRMARLHEQPQGRAEDNRASFGQLLAMAEAQPHVRDSWTVAQCIWSAFKLEYCFSVQQQAAWQQWSAEALRSKKCSAQAAANLLYGWSKLGLPLQDELAKAAEAAIQRTAAAMDPQHVSNTLYDFGSAGWQLTQPSADALASAMERHLAAGSPNGQNVQNFLWGCAELGNVVPQTLLDAAAAWADARWPQLAAIDAADLPYQLSRLGAMQRPPWQPQDAWMGRALARWVRLPVRWYSVGCDKLLHIHLTPP